MARSWAHDVAALVLGQSVLINTSPPSSAFGPSQALMSRWSVPLSVGAFCFTSRRILLQRHRLLSRQFNITARHCGRVATALILLLPQVLMPPISGRRIVDFGVGLGRKTLFLYNLPEVGCYCHPVPLSWLCCDLQAVCRAALSGSVA